ncbi:winged helix-turn-helix transcriptional regulator [Chitinophaga nivalis]|uniref:Winged helix-turn-helix transcriptional regulator n=1 Tax=Chitinophaga nivalis TaxID=2991709 RepID=A0ABT3ISA0_9BACT|nr:winged helix-turn-helix transcriptional regulator [Chitinophaga nivalis]MCW3463486.1 winged helix-turn-helix transcriptional regulator [Chitinophaga nivalis]MCW3486824.1 winged helix-turn-helix transcriptional regulator [Chitinophaga nivalis]
MKQIKESSTNFSNKENLIAICTEAYAMDLIGARWKLSIFYELKYGPARFSELKKKIANVTERMLTLHLREMERDGLVNRTVYPEVPARVEYSLTDSASELLPVWDYLRAWGKRHRTRQEGEEPGPFTITPIC